MGFINAAETYAARTSERRGVPFRDYDMGHVRIYDALDTLHKEMCRMDSSNIWLWFDAYPGLRDMLNDWAEGQGVRQWHEADRVEDITYSEMEAEEDKPKGDPVMDFILGEHL